MERKSQGIPGDRQVGVRSRPAHSDPGRVDKTLVEMVQCRLGLFLGLEADEAELAELAIFGELEAAVCQRAEGGEELPETLLLHLGQDGNREGGARRPQSQRDKTGGEPETPGLLPSGGAVAEHALWLAPGSNSSSSACLCVALTKSLHQ